MDKEKINCKIKYVANDDPKVKILVNGKKVHEFIGNAEEETLNFSVASGDFTFRIVHYGKDMKREVNKFFEVKNIYFNDIDIKGLIWETTQVAELPSWQKQDDFNWKSNLYLGHNAYLDYKLQSPILEFLLEYHTKGAKVSSNMGSYDMDLLYEMKRYFSRIVKEQDEQSQ